MGRGIIGHRIPKIIAILGGILVLVGAEPVSPAHADWRTVPTDKQQINMHVPGMEHWNPGHWKRIDEETASNRGTAYYSKWRSIEDYGIHALLFYAKRTKQFYYYSVKEQIQRQLEGNFHSFEGNENIYKSKIGEFEYIQFSANAGQVKRKCVGFQHMSQGKNKMIYGHYCLSGDKPVDDDMVGPLIDSINLDFQALKNEKRTSIKKDITAGRSGRYDGIWEGMMSCGSCPNCIGPLEKRLNINIEDSKFDIVPDASYMGVGVIDDAGNVSIDWNPDSPDWTRQSRRNFRFVGRYSGDSFVLHGVRGPRSCDIALSRVSSQ